MYKNIILSIIIVFLAACSKPKPEIVPSWYTNIPSDYKLFYAVASSDTIEQAKKIAIANMRERLCAQVNLSFDNKNHKLQKISKKSLEKIKQYNIEVSNRLSLNRVKLEKSKTFRGKELVLISIPRIKLFKKIKIISDVKFHRAQEADKRALNKNAIDRFMALELAVKEWEVLASLAEYKEFLISTYSASDEFIFLNKLRKEYKELKDSINFYVLSDGNSRIFSRTIKNAIEAKGLSVKNEIDSKNSFKLLITSTTKEEKEYTFNKSSTLVKLTTFDNEKNKVSFRQHTFIGKSRKNYKEAKDQAAIHLHYKVKKLGIFDFIGFSK